MKILRRKTKVIKIGNILIGGKNPIAIQSMVKTKTSNTQDTIRQIKGLEAAGSDIVRLAIKDNLDARGLKEIKQGVNLPLVADIHFDWRLALQAINNGADKVRLNPGNIYKREQVRQIAQEARIARIPIRVGLNSGSLASYKTKAKGLILKQRKYAQGKRKIAKEMVASALDYIKILEGVGFYDIVVSLKASDIFDTIEAYRIMAKLCDYPFHLGVTATGAPYSGMIKSAIALSILLLEGIGDTIRVSLTEEPTQEIKAAESILEAIGLRRFAAEIISCPTCGRCEVDLVKIVKELDRRLSALNSQLQTKPLKIAVMGCVVNGPGEARTADLGVAFGRREGLLFKKGRSIRKISYKSCVDSLLKEMNK